MSDARSNNKVMTSRDFLRALLRRSWLIVLVVVVAAGGVFLLRPGRPRCTRRPLKTDLRAADHRRVFGDRPVGHRPLRTAGRRPERRRRHQQPRHPPADGGRCRRHDAVHAHGPAGRFGQQQRPGRRGRHHHRDEQSAGGRARRGQRLRHVVHHVQQAGAGGAARQRPERDQAADGDVHHARRASLLELPAARPKRPEPAGQQGDGDRRLQPQRACHVTVGPLPAAAAAHRRPGAGHQPVHRRRPRAVARAVQHEGALASRGRRRARHARHRTRAARETQIDHRRPPGRGPRHARPGCRVASSPAQQPRLPRRDGGALDGARDQRHARRGQVGDGVQPGRHPRHGRAPRGARRRRPATAQPAPVHGPVEHGRRVQRGRRQGAARQGPARLQPAAVWTGT